jgi:hypothetical protein
MATAGRRFVLRPAAALESRTNDVILVEAGRELGRVIAFDHGHVIDVANADDHTANRHSRGGWMQSRIQRGLDRQAELHLAEVVAIVERLHEPLGSPPIVIAATEEHAAAVRERMNDATAGAVIGVLGNARDAAVAQLYDEVRRLADEHDARREAVLLDRRAEQLGREEVGNGLEGVLDAAYTGGSRPCSSRGAPIPTSSRARSAADWARRHVSARTTRRSCSTSLTGSRPWRPRRCAPTGRCGS